MNVLIAWLTVNFAKELPYTSMSETDSLAVGRQSIGSAWPSKGTDGELYPSWPGVTRAVVSTPPEVTGAWVLSITRAGLPLPSMAGGYLAEPRGIRTIHCIYPFGCEFPLLPIWPGFAINTIFYAGIVWLLSAIAATIKRGRRLRRGLCPLCAYDMRGSIQMGTCPECGWSTAEPRRRHSSRAPSPMKM